MVFWERMETKLGFDWDEANIQHLARHKLTPEEFEQAVLRDPILVGYENVDGEDRWTGLGATDSLRVLVLVFTIRGGCVRAVTAYDADKKRAEAFWKERGQ